jgi:hypothetical protein
VSVEVQPRIDLVAHVINNKGPRYFALRGELVGRAEILNTFLIRWSNKIPYVLPSPQLIGAVL